MLKQDMANPKPENEPKPDPAVSGSPAVRSERGGVVVLGMHRTGTSAVTKILVDMGYDLPGEAVPASRDNPKGYWEPAEIVEIHDEYLQAIGRSWSDPRYLPGELFHNEAAATAREKLQLAMESIAQSCERWVLKDPRMCRLMPLWDGLLVKENEPHYLHILRSPLSVAASLAERDGFSERKANLLWLRHNLEVEAATRGKDRTWLHFEKLIGSAPVYVIERFRKVTGSHHLSVKRLQDAVAENLDHELVHHEYGLEESFERLGQFPWIAKAYEALGLLGSEHEAAGLVSLDELREEVGSADALLLGDPVAWEAENHGERSFRLSAKIAQFHRSIEVQRREIEAHRAEVDAMRTALDANLEQHTTLVEKVTQHQVTAEDQRRHLAESLDDLAEQQLALLERSLETQRNELETTREALAAGREQLAEVTERTSAIEKAITERIEKHHLGVLAKSLDAIARIEKHWLSAQDQLAEATRERDAAVRDHDHIRQDADATRSELDAKSRECDRAHRELDAKSQECDRAHRDLIAARGELDAAHRDLTRTHRDLDTTHRQLDDSLAEITQLQQRRSWRVTAPLRWCYSVLKNPLRRS